MSELDRRDFLKIVGLSAGAAATAGCEDPASKLIADVVQPEEITPGIAVVYASTCQECSAACGLHVKTREGRPIKLEGNPDHPINRGRLCARGQAGIGRCGCGRGYHSSCRLSGQSRHAVGHSDVPHPGDATGRDATIARQGQPPAASRQAMMSGSS